jgi:hypothetical protein
MIGVPLIPCLKVLLTTFFLPDRVGASRYSIISTIPSLGEKDAVKRVGIFGIPGATE